MQLWRRGRACLHQFRTQVIIENLNVSGYAFGIGGPRGLAINGGFVDIRGVHAEQVAQPVQVNISGGVTASMVRARMAMDGVDCVGMFTLTGSTTVGNFMIRPPMAVNCCTRLVTNNQPGATTHMSSAKATDVVFTPDPRALVENERSRTDNHRRRFQP